MEAEAHTAKADDGSRRVLVSDRGWRVLSVRIGCVSGIGSLMTAQPYKRDEPASSWQSLLGDEATQELIEQAHKDALRIREGREVAEDFK